jgi:enoyl-CoA hydratase
VPGEDLLDECFDLAERMSRFSRPGLELTKRTRWSGLDAASHEAHIHQEGLGQLRVRLLTDNVEEATAARKDKREPRVRDRR